MIRTLLAALMLCAFALPSFAQTVEPVPVTLEWDWPELRCDGSLIFVDQIDQAEIYIDTAPIPSASEDAGNGPCGDVEDLPDPGADYELVQTVTTDATSVDIELRRGATYYFRMRVQVNGHWSNFTGQAEYDIDFARPGIPIIIRIG